MKNLHNLDTGTLYRMLSKERELAAKSIVAVTYRKGEILKLQKLIYLRELTITPYKTSRKKINSGKC